MWDCLDKLKITRCNSFNVIRKKMNEVYIFFLWISFTGPLLTPSDVGRHLLKVDVKVFSSIRGMKSGEAMRSVVS